MFYGTQTGTAEQYALDLSKKLKENFQVDVVIKVCVQVNILPILLLFLCLNAPCTNPTRSENQNLDFDKIQWSICHRTHQEELCCIGNSDILHATF